MAKNFAPTPPADTPLVALPVLKTPPTSLDAIAARQASTLTTAPTDPSQQRFQSGAAKTRQARKKTGRLNDPDLDMDEAQSGPLPDTVLVTDSAGRTPDSALQPTELSQDAMQPSAALAEPLVLAQALIGSAPTLASASATTSAVAAASAASSAPALGAVGFMALASIAVVVHQSATSLQDPAPQAVDTPATTAVSLVVQDGYLDGAEVWVDLNDNGVIDTLVDYQLGISVNGKVDGVLTDAQKLHALITTGGTDISTSLAFQGSYSATAGSTVVNPLTSLVQSMVQSSLGSTIGMTGAQKLARINAVKAEAMSAVNSALGLPEGADLTRIDTISTSTAKTGDQGSGISLEQALVINSQALMVANMMAMGAAALQGAATGSGVAPPSMSSLSDFVVSGIVKAIYNASDAGLTLALGDNASLSAILNSASTAASAAASASGGTFVMDAAKMTRAADAVATSVSSANSLIMTLTGQAIAANAMEPGSATGALTQMLAAQKTVLNQLDELQNSDLRVLNTYTDVPRLFTASQSVENTAGLKLGTQTVTAPVMAIDNTQASVTLVTVKPVKSGDLAQFVVQLSESVFVQTTGQGKPTLVVQNTATSETIASYDPGLSRGDTLVFTYRVKDSDTLLGVALGTSIQLRAGSQIQDLAGNEALLSLNNGLQNFQAAQVLGRTLDTLAPTLTITSDVGTLKAGETATVTFSFSEDPGNSFAWDGTAGDIGVGGGSLSAISGSGLVRTATFTPTAGLASGSASITVASASYLDAAGNSGSAGSTPVIGIDTLAPRATFSAVKNSDGASLAAGSTNSTRLELSGSNEAGGRISVYNSSVLLGPADVVDKGWTYSISTQEGSTYDLRVQETDTAGNVGPMTTYFAGAGDAVIDLGEGNGQLIAPVQVDGGKWFYHWDVSGDGTATDQDDTGQPKDQVAGWRLHDIFRNDVNGYVGPGTSETYRYATLNGVPLALPTMGLLGKDLSDPTALTDAKDWMYIVQASTAIGSVEGEGDNTINPLYDDLLAIWDAHNGTAISAVQIGEPWANEGVRMDLLGVDPSQPIEFTATFNGVAITASRPINANQGDVAHFFYASDVEAAFQLAINDYNAKNDDALLDLSEDLDDVNQLLVTRTLLDGSRETGTLSLDPSTLTANPPWASYDDGTVYIRGTPKNWNSAGWGEYASATPSFVWGTQNLERHYDLMFNGGMPAEMSEGIRDTAWNPVMVAVEVLGRPMIVRLHNLAPVWDTTGGLVAYPENGVGIAYQANATDANQDTVTYALAGVDAALFHIVAATGAVSFKAPPDHETALDDGLNNVYNITVTASDGVNASLAHPVAINVTNSVDIDVTVSLAKVAEGDAANLVYTFTRSGDTGGELTVNIGMSGSATDSDFTTQLNASTTQITFAAGSSTATLAVQAQADQLTEGNETVTVTVLAGQGYELGTRWVANGSIEDKLASHATALNMNARTPGRISVVEETDLYSMALTKGEKYIFTLEAQSTDTGAGLDAGLNLFATRSASNEHLLRTNNNAFKLNNNSRITYVAPETGTYYLQAQGVSETRGDYVLSVSDQNVPQPSRIAIPNPPTDSASPNPDFQWKYIPSRGTGAEFYLIIDAPKSGPRWTADNLPYWTDLENRSLLVNMANGKAFEHNGDQGGMRSGNIFEWDGPTIQSHIMQDLSRNTDYVYVVPRGAITGENGLTNDYYESTIYRTTNDAVGPKVISGGIIMGVFSSDVYFPIDPNWGGLKLDVASSNTFSTPFIVDDVPDLLWIQFDEKIRSSTGGWNQGWAAKHNDVFDGVYLKENGVAILEFDVNFDDITHDPNQWGAPFRYPTGLLNVIDIGSEVLGGLPWVDSSGLENGMWLNLHQAVSSWGGQYAYADYVSDYKFKEGVTYTLVVDAPIEDLYFNLSDVSEPLLEFSFMIDSTHQALVFNVASHVL
jgi:hypothetical protein